jgi:hypothetical protein
VFGHRRLALRRLFVSREARLFGSWVVIGLNAFLLVIPHFACRCADGRIKPFCIPGRCTDCETTGTGRGCSGRQGARCCSKTTCCAKATCCTEPKATVPSHQQSEEPTVSQLPCCKLVMQSSPPVTQHTVTEFIPSIDLHDWIVDLPVDPSRLAFVLWQHRLVDDSPPPDDLVITQLRLTI